jgi:hypothetical protein
MIFFILFFSGESDWELPACGDVQEEGHTSAVSRRREGVLQRGAGDDHGRDPEGLHGGRVVRQPPLLPGRPLGAPHRRRPGREVPQEVRRAHADHGNPRAQGGDYTSSKAQSHFDQRGQEEVDGEKLVWNLGFRTVFKRFLACEVGFVGMYCPLITCILSVCENVCYEYEA